MRKRATVLMLPGSLVYQVATMARVMLGLLCHFILVRMQEDGTKIISAIHENGEAQVSRDVLPFRQENVRMLESEARLQWKPLQEKQRKKTTFIPAVSTLNQTLSSPKVQQNPLQQRQTLRSLD